MKCDYCGADVRPGTVQCDFCGSTPKRAGSHSLSHAEIFARLKQSPAFAQRNDEGRAQLLAPKAAVRKVAAQASWFSGGTTIMIILAVFSLGPLCFFGIPLIPFVIGWLIWRYKTGRPVFGDALSPIDENLPGRPAILIGRRTEISGQGGHTKSAYFVTAEFEDSDRTEFMAATPSLYAHLAEGDAGILFAQDHPPQAMAFERVRI
jgi:hypothetical protein